MAAALDADAVEPSTPFLDTGVIMVGGVAIHNWDRGAWGPQDMTGCMQHSLNVCLAWVATQLGPSKFYSYMNSFGIGHFTGMDLAGEVSQPVLVPGDTGWYEVNLGTNSFGQGIAATPIQMVTAISAVANDGKMMAPHVLKAVIENGEQYNNPPQVIGTPISKETAQTLTEMLAISLEKESSVALVEGYRIAGKTGTAEIPGPAVTCERHQRLLCRLGPGGRPAFCGLRLAGKTTEFSMGFGCRRSGLQRSRLEPDHLDGPASGRCPPGDGQSTISCEKCNDTGDFVLTLADILEALTGKRNELASLVISEAAIDSRQVIPGALFVALPGERTDGHNYVGAAFKNGAVLALVQRDMAPEFVTLDLRSGPISADTTLPVALRTSQPFCLRVNDTLDALQQLAAFWRRKHDLRVIGITGSVGKSTTKELVAEVLSQRYHTLKNPGNLNNEIGLPLTLLRLGPGTNGPSWRWVFTFPARSPSCARSPGRRSESSPTSARCTPNGPARRKPSRAAKPSWCRPCPPAPDGVAILNYDDPWVRGMAEQTTARVLFYGMDSAADLWADEVESMGLEGIRFRLHYKGEILHLRVPLIGHHSVHTALRAAAVGLTEGLAWGEIVYGLQHGTNPAAPGGSPHRKRRADAG